MFQIHIRVSVQEGYTRYNMPYAIPMLYLYIISNKYIYICEYVGPPNQFLACYRRCVCNLVWPSFVNKFSNTHMCSNGWWFACFNFFLVSALALLYIYIYIWYMFKWYVQIWSHVLCRHGVPHEHADGASAYRHNNTARYIRRWKMLYTNNVSDNGVLTGMPHTVQLLLMVTAR